MRSKSDITEKWKKETILQDRRSKIVILMDKYARGVQTGDYVMMKEARDDVFTSFENIELKGGVVQALAERERILGIIDSYNLGGQLDGIIEQIKN